MFFSGQWGKKHKNCCFIICSCRDFLLKRKYFVMTHKCLSWSPALHLKHLIWHHCDWGRSKRTGLSLTAKSHYWVDKGKLCVVFGAQEITWESLHLMDSTVDNTLLTEGFSEAVYKNKYSPKISDYSSLLIPSTCLCFARFQRSNGVKQNKGVWQGAMWF